MGPLHDRIVDLARGFARDLILLYTQAPIESLTLERPSVSQLDTLTRGIGVWPFSEPVSFCSTAPVKEAKAHLPTKKRSRAKKSVKRIVKAKKPVVRVRRGKIKRAK
jgi:hypothetical protein